MDGLEQKPLKMKRSASQIEAEIQNMEEEHVKGINICSRAWLEWGEKCSQYFFHQYQTQRAPMAANRIQQPSKQQPLHPLPIFINMYVLSTKNYIIKITHPTMTSENI